ncbi:Formyltetrahydrofolate deformylase [Coccomyxa subellipsoidea C-169]|uniref:Formyltetrahydrofolate deformylase n=1 Tax=Coccomyxa subellipsoidea (strain C-169) TaxID=574566 RepID=I0Z0S8_COCSC|nr:Formyltetrahydrofolate deformylase [Coccomyxa subellipsoidea C-169]EIE24247.1 Formyltetrahydrofolate deformylase [Coccomyxa subellipsoidea C-169]|eukprot:XP_005648791.1 Formyltetrahydrofolate deformylase [Coccomyxa subellipsoidea C-169]
MVKCPDRKGVIAALAQLLYGLGCNILASDQFTAEEGVYFQRIRFDLTDMVVGTANKAVLERAIAEVADRFGMEWRLFYDGAVKRVAILVSRLDHCLYDILIRHRAGELKCEIPIIISNHPDLEGIATSFGIPFKHLPVAPGSGPEGKRSQIEALLEELGVDLIVLARYMQIFSEEFCSRNAMRTINIHHSFLPAFEGAKPYHRAYERGVKVIGATAHYATSELDAGPIIEQDVTRISHRDSVQDMIRKGRDLERLVLARALRSVLSDSVMVNGNRTVVFEI